MNPFLHLDDANASIRTISDLSALNAENVGLGVTLTSFNSNIFLIYIFSACN